MNSHDNQDDGTKNKECVTSPRILLNTGLLAFAHNHFKAASELFHQVIEFEKKRSHNKTFSFDHHSTSSSTTISTTQQQGGGGNEGGGDFVESIMIIPTSPEDLLSTAFFGIDIEENLMIEAINNFSIC
eukprot:CAMPEP_0114376606 /NCGR_PEP_ID=MMETSP0102-20121206/476_1 /TAXON_ID=38822 ORGANISM="Pteridomonas danica, Strain PT" /NCGR_SAMPLE_ID=MMETSP0102 /ASSEMBLY_ACC=CAM_ASM_000212 /LENGTH=128 /DNA_ID=CAMNT_0001530973 /DNA_START=252 /DNA_END=635 /DNA_ORIENTATION=-